MLSVAKRWLLHTPKGIRLCGREQPRWDTGLRRRVSPTAGCGSRWVLRVPVHSRERPATTHCSVRLVPAKFWPRREHIKKMEVHP